MEQAAAVRVIHVVTVTIVRLAVLVADTLYRQLKHHRAVNIQYVQVDHGDVQDRILVRPVGVANRMLLDTTYLTSVLSEAVEDLRVSKVTSGDKDIKSHVLTVIFVVYMVLILE
jgi:hypothetical protein